MTSRRTASRTPRLTLPAIPGPVPGLVPGLLPKLAATILLTAAILLAAAVPAAAQPERAERTGPPDLATLFPSRAPIVLDDDRNDQDDRRATGGGLVRLLLPPEVLGACRGDLSDLRILDAAGREVPYLVDAGWPGQGPDTALQVLERRTPRILGADRTTTDPDGGSGGTPALRTESYTLAAPPEAPAGQGWTLVLVTSRPRFVRAIVVTPGGIGEARTETSGAGGVLAEGSIFRLAPSPATGGARQAQVRERLEIALPESLPPRLTVTLSGEEDAFLAPGFRYERSRRIPGQDRARVPLARVDGRGDGGPTGPSHRTVLELDRPRGLVPGALVLDTATAAFNRRVEVWDEGPGAADHPLGAATLYRVPAPSWMDAPIEARTIPIATPRGDRLRVVIEDGDSPPLEAIAVRAALRRPALVFSPGSAAAGDQAVGTLLFGGGRAFRPRYDLQALLPALTPGGPPVEGQAAEIAERLVDPALLAHAHLGAVEPNPRFDPRPALAFAHRPGAPVEARRFRFRRSLAVAPSDDGLARLTLSPADLADARPDLADLRIVGAADGGDEHGEGDEPRQWAYLLEPGAARHQQALPVERRDGDEPGTSLYRLTLPATPATLDRLVLDSSAPYFDRPFTLRATVPATDRRPGGARGGDAREIVLASGRLQRRVGDPRPVTLAFAPTRIERLELEVDDGSDAPLAIGPVQGRFPLPTLYFPVPQGDYALLLGDPDASAPSYELTRARSLVLAVASAPAKAGPLDDNPAYSRAAGLLSAGGLQRILLWGALLAAVLVLGFFTLRLARRES